MLLNLKEVPTHLGIPLRVDAGDVAHALAKEQFETEKRYVRVPWIAHAVAEPLVSGVQDFHGRARRVWYTRIRPTESAPPEHFLVFGAPREDAVKLMTWYSAEERYAENILRGLKLE